MLPEGARRIIFDLTRRKPLEAELRRRREHVMQVSGGGIMDHHPRDEKIIADQTERIQVIQTELARFKR